MCRGMCRCVEGCADVSMYGQICSGMCISDWVVQQSDCCLCLVSKRGLQCKLMRPFGISNARQLLEPQHTIILNLLAGDTLKDWTHNVVTSKFVVNSWDYRTPLAMKNIEGWIWKHVKGNGSHLLQTLFLYFASETEEFYGNSAGSFWDVNTFIYTEYHETVLKIYNTPVLPTFI